MSVACSLPSRDYRDETNFLTTAGLGELVPIFKEQEIEIEMIPRLDDMSLRELGILTIGGRRRICDLASNFH